MSTTEAIAACRALLSAPPVPMLGRAVDRDARARACAAMLAEVAA